MKLSKNEIEKLFVGFSNMKVMIIGDVMLDSYLMGKVERISPEAPVPVVNVKHRELRPGGAANVALNIAALGATPILCSVVGKDRHGDDFLDIISEKHLTTEGIIQSKQRPTTVKSRIIGNNSQLLRVDEETEAPLSTIENSALFTVIENYLDSEDIDLIILEDYDKGVFNKTLIEKIVLKARILDIPVVVDPKHKNFDYYKGVTLFKPNLKELREGLKIEDIDYKDQKKFTKVIFSLMDKMDIKVVFNTLSENGVAVCYKDEDGQKNYKHIPAVIRHIADVSGAGDTVISVAGLCLASGMAPEMFAAIANLAGGLVCEEVGVVPIDAENLKAEIAASEF